MKTIFIISILTLVSSLSYSQAIADVPSVNEMAQELAKTSSDEFTLTHSRAATTQIKHQLVRKVRYPEVMLENNIEGMVTIEVDISEAGKILQYNIIESDAPAFSKAVNKAMKSIRDLDLKGKSYLGADKVRVEMNFSIGN